MLPGQSDVHAEGKEEKVRSIMLHVAASLPDDDGRTAGAFAADFERVLKDSCYDVAVTTAEVVMAEVVYDEPEVER